MPPIEVRRWTTEQLLDGERALLAMLEADAARDAIRRAGRVLRSGEPIEVERAALSGMQLAIDHLLGQHAMTIEGPGVGDGAGIAPHCTCGRRADDVPCQHLACLLLALVVHLDPDPPAPPADRWRAVAGGGRGAAPGAVRPGLAGGTMSETTTPAAAEAPAWLTRAELLTIDWCQQRLYARLIDEWTAASCRTARRAQLEAEIARCEEARRFLDRLWRETDLLPGIPEPTNAGTWRMLAGRSVRVGTGSDGHAVFTASDLAAALAHQLGRGCRRPAALLDLRMPRFLVGG